MEYDQTLALVKLRLEQELDKREVSPADIVASKRSLSALYSTVYHLATRERIPQALIYAQCVTCMQDFSMSLVEGVDSANSLLELDIQLKDLLAMYHLGAKKILLVYRYLDMFHVYFFSLPPLAVTSRQMFNQHVFYKVAFPSVFEQLVVRACGDDEHELMDFPPTIANQLEIWNGTHHDWTQTRLEIAKRKWLVCRLLSKSSPLPSELIRVVCGLLG
ncbi:hypothetical protein BASA81_014011 [Batrachochytrium salamandrivorans]|nr:hypothetical protein BASA81_014011 [Batrachochytrium salamandrivorans]